MLEQGIYEQVISDGLDKELASVGDKLSCTAPIDSGESSKILASYVTDVIQKGLDNVLDNGGDLSTQVSLTNQLIALIEQETGESDFAAQAVATRAEQLHSYFLSCPVQLHYQQSSCRRFKADFPLAW